MGTPKRRLRLQAVGSGPTDELDRRIQVHRLRSATEAREYLNHIPSRAPCGDAEPVSIRIDKCALPAGETLLIDGYPELFGHGIDILDIQVNQGVRPRIALVLRQVEPDISTRHGHEPWEAGLELVLPLFDEPKAPVPCDRPRRFLDIEHRHNLLVHGPETNAR